jgi:membrane-bound ClpP family serine protease
MLSQHERRQLDAIERGLAAQYPALATRLSGSVLDRRRWALEAMWAFGLCCFVLGIVVNSGELGLSGLAFLIAGLLLRHRKYLYTLFSG